MALTSEDRTISSRELGQLLTCPVCLDRFTDPRVLPCQHTFCLSCIQGVSGDSRDGLRCPQCRSNHQLPGGIRRLPPNLTINAFLDLSDTENTPSLPTSHCRVSTNCVECRRPLASNPPPHPDQSGRCSSCYSKRETKKQQVQYASLQVRTLLNGIRAKTENIHQRQGELERNCNAVKVDIESMIRSLMDLINHRKRELEQQVEQFYQQESRLIQDENEVLEVEQATVASLCDCADASVVQTDISTVDLENVNSALQRCMSDYNTQHTSRSKARRVLKLYANDSLHGSLKSFGTVQITAQNLQMPAAGLSPRGPQPRRRWDMMSPAFPQPRASIPISTRSSSVTSDDELPVTPLRTPMPAPATAAPLIRVSQSLPRSSTSLLEPPESRLMRKAFPTKIVGQKGRDAGSFMLPCGVAVDTHGIILVADSSNQRVQRLHRDGTFLDKFGSYGASARIGLRPEFDCPTGICVSPFRGDIVVTDRYNHRILILDGQTGVVSAAFGQEGEGRGRLRSPWGVACDNEGNILVADKDNHRIQVLDRRNGQFVAVVLSGPKRVPFVNPHYVAFDDHIVAVSNTGCHRVELFDARNGYACLRTIGSEGAADGQLKYPRGVAIDSCGLCLVADCGNSRVVVFDLQGNYMHQFGSWGSEDGQFKDCEDLAVTSVGDVIVADRKNHRLQIF